MPDGKATRRELIKPLAALVAAPVLLDGKEVGKSYQIESKYLVFINAAQVELFDFVQKSIGVLPAGTPVYAVYPRPYGMDEMIRIYKVDDNG